MLKSTSEDSLVQWQLESTENALACAVVSFVYKMRTTTSVHRPTIFSSNGSRIEFRSMYVNYE